MTRRSPQSNARRVLRRPNVKHALQRDVPDFDKWEPQVIEYVRDENPYALDMLTGSAIVNRVVDIIGVLHMREQKKLREMADVSQ